MTTESLRVLQAANESPDNPSSSAQQGFNPLADPPYLDNFVIACSISSITSLPRKCGLQQGRDVNDPEAKCHLCQTIQGLSTYGVRSMASSVLASLRDGATPGSLGTLSPVRAKTAGDGLTFERCRSERCDNMASRMPAG